MTDLSNLDPPDMVRLQSLIGSVLGTTAGDMSDFASVARRIRMLETVLEAVPVGVVVADYPTGQVLMGNRRMTELVRHPIRFSQSIDDYSDWSSFHADGRPVAPQEYPLTRIIEEGIDRAELDVNYQRGDGTMCWMRIIGNVVEDDHGERIGAAVVMFEIERERQYQDQQQLLIRELNHRFKNMLSVIRSTINQSLRIAGVDDDILDALGSRLDAFAQAHDQVFGFDDRALPLRDICSGALGALIGDGRVIVTGPDLCLPERPAVALAMVLHELSTNAIKYGALSVTEGRVDIDWTVSDSVPRMVDLRWRERGGPPPPADVALRPKGFGSIVTHRAAAMQTSGIVTADYTPLGYHWSLRFPAD